MSQRLSTASSICGRSKPREEVGVSFYKRKQNPIRNKTAPALQSAWKAWTRHSFLFYYYHFCSFKHKKCGVTVSYNTARAPAGTSCIWLQPSPLPCLFSNNNFLTSPVFQKEKGYEETTIWKRSWKQPLTTKQKETQNKKKSKNH